MPRTLQQQGAISEALVHLSGARHARNRIRSPLLLIININNMCIYIYIYIYTYILCG